MTDIDTAEIRAHHATTLCAHIGDCSIGATCERMRLVEALDAARAMRDSRAVYTRRVRAFAQAAETQLLTERARAVAAEARIAAAMALPTSGSFGAPAVDRAAMIAALTGGTE